MPDPENNSPEEKPQGKPAVKKTGTSADSVTETAELTRQLSETQEKLNKVEKTKENEKLISGIQGELDLLKSKIPLVAKSGGKPFWQEWLDELDEFLSEKD